MRRLSLVLVTAATFAGFLALSAAPAAATVPSGNLVQNPGAESDTGSTDSSCGSGATVSAWKPVLLGGGTTGGPPMFTEVQYGTAGYPDQSQSATIGGGSNFFTGGCNASSAGYQLIDLSASSAEIDTGNIQATLAADLGGYANQADNATATLTFYDGSDSRLGSITIGPVTAADRGNQTELLPRQTQATVPVGTRTLVVSLGFNRVSGNDNDGSADNVSVTLTDTTQTQRQLSVTLAGTGSGSVIGNTSPAITCPGACQQRYSDGTAVTLTEHAHAGSVFAGWGDGCASAGMATTCQVTLGADSTVSASFTKIPRPTNTTAPSMGISGSHRRGLSPTYGSHLFCKPGTWTGNPSLSYSWFATDRVRFAVGRKRPHPIKVIAPFAHGQTAVLPDLRPASTDVFCLVTAVNAGGQAWAQSPPRTVAAVRPALLRRCFVRGRSGKCAKTAITPAVGVDGTNRCTPGSWGHWPSSFHYAWYRIRPARLSIHHERRELLHVGQTYTIGAEAELHEIECVVTARNRAGSAKAESNRYLVPLGAARVVDGPSVQVDASLPSASGLIGPNDSGASFGAQKVDLGCQNGRWSRGDLTYGATWTYTGLADFTPPDQRPLSVRVKYERSARERASTDISQKTGLGIPLAPGWDLKLDMTPGTPAGSELPDEFDGWLQCVVTATTSHGVRSTARSAQIYVSNGCQVAFIGIPFKLFVTGKVGTWGPACLDYQRYWEDRNYDVEQDPPPADISAH